MYLQRIGRISLAKTAIHKLPKEGDGSYEVFDLVDLSVLNKAHLYNGVSSARLYVFVNGVITIECRTPHGKGPTMRGRCTPREWARLRAMT